MLISPAAGAWLSGMPDFLLLLWDDGRMAPVPMRPSFTGARVEIISERCLWVTSATFGLGGRVSLTATELSSEYLRRCTLAWVMAKNFARGTSIRAGCCRSRCTSSCPQVIWIEEQHAEDPRSSRPIARDRGVLSNFEMRFRRYGASIFVARLQSRSAFSASAEIQRLLAAFESGLVLRDQNRRAQAPFDPARAKTRRGQALAGQKCTQELRVVPQCTQELRVVRNVRRNCVWSAGG